MLSRSSFFLTVFHHSHSLSIFCCTRIHGVGVYSILTQICSAVAERSSSGWGGGGTEFQCHLAQQLDNWMWWNSTVQVEPLKFLWLAMVSICYYDHSMTTVWPKSLVKSAGKCWSLLTHIIHIHMVHMLSRRWRSVRWTCWRFSPPWPCNRRGFGNCIGLGWNMMKLIKPNTVTMVPRLLIVIDAHYMCWLCRLIANG